MTKRVQQMRCNLKRTDFQLYLLVSHIIRLVPVASGDKSIAE